MCTTDNNHGAQTQFHSGRHMLDGEFPTLGAWVHYGLGSLNDNLPQFISMGNREYWNAKDGHYLGPAHDAVPLRVDPANPLDYGKPEGDRDRRRAASSASTWSASSTSCAASSIPTTRPSMPASRPTSWPSACRRRCPKCSNFAEETAGDARSSTASTDPTTRDFGMQLLAARRLVERGVRFIQIQHGAGGAGVWDAHGGLKANHAKNCRPVDQADRRLAQGPEAARAARLRRSSSAPREFGRTPGTQGSDGRDHHIYGFSVWMAGGGIKGGIVHGATDEIGFHAVENRHYVTDIHATILHQLGLDSRKLEIPGRKRLDIDHGKPIAEIIV